MRICGLPTEPGEIQLQGFLFVYTIVVIAPLCGVVVVLSVTFW